MQCIIKGKCAAVNSETDSQIGYAELVRLPYNPVVSQISARKSRTPY